MTTIHNLIAFLLLAAFLACHPNSESNNKKSFISALPQRLTQLTPQTTAQLDSLNINFQLRAHCYAYSSDQNAEPSNGEAHSDNLPNPVDNTFPKVGFYLVINQQEWTIIDSSFLGCKLYLVNTTDTSIRLYARDSRLYIEAEALDRHNNWVPITYFPSSYCGNSAHTVVLDKNEYWDFDVPVFKGRFKTKLRYTLKISKEQEISSNEVVVYLNEEQFNKNKKQGYSSTNLMDPYQE